MQRISNPITHLRDSMWYRITAHILTVVLCLNITAPVYAAVKIAQQVEDVEEYLYSSVRYEFMQDVREHLYKATFESKAASIFDGFGYFYDQVSAHNSNAFEDVKLVPINVSDITIFVPVAPKKPLYIGTPYVERGLIKQQLSQLLNKAWISGNGYNNFNELTKDLYQNAIHVLDEKQFKFGQNLTLEQIKSINKDIIWPEKRTLSTGKSVYVPFIYLTQATINSNKITNSTFSFDTAEINTKSFTVNGARIEARRDLLIKTLEDFNSISGGSVGSGGDLTISAGRNLNNLSGSISGQNVTLIANKLTNDTLVTRFDYGHGYSESFDTLGTISSLGDLNIQTSGDVISHGGQFDTQGTMRIQAGGDVLLLTQEAKNERHESGNGWTDNESSLVNLQTHLSAVDLLSIVTNGNIISQAAIIESEGILELLAGMGITIIPAENVTSSSSSFEASSSGTFGTDVSESSDIKRATIVRSLLKAGNSMVLKTEQGNIVLKAVAVDTLGAAKLIAEHGDIQLLISRHAESADYKESYEGSLSYRHQGHGYYREKAYYNEFVTGGGLMLDAFNGVRIEYAGHADDLDKTIEELAHSPELAWMKDIRDRSQSGEIDPAVWENVELIMNEWNYDDSGLSPAAMAIIAVVVSIVTYGAGAAIVGTAGGALNGAMVAAVQAGVTGLTNQVTTSLLGNGFDLSATLKELESSDTVKKLATSMVTAGVISGLDTALFDGYINIDEPSIWAQSAQAVTHAAINTSVPLLINGESFDDFGESFLNSVAMSAVNTLGEKVANKIGEAAKDNKIGDATKYIAHAALGCTLGSMTTAVNGTNSRGVSEGCWSGAAGGVVGEYIGSTYRDDIDQIETETAEKIEAIMKEELVNDTGESVQEYAKKQNQRFLELRQQGIDISKLAAGISVLVLEGDVDVGIQTGGNAAENNALFIPIMFMAVRIALMAYTAYEVKQAVEKIVDLIKNGTDDQIRNELQGVLLEAGAEVAFGQIAKALKAGEKLKSILDRLSTDELVEATQKLLTGRGQHNLAADIGNASACMKGNSHCEISTSSKPPATRDELSHAAYRARYPGSTLSESQYAEQLKNKNIGEDGRWRNNDTTGKPSIVGTPKTPVRFENLDPKEYENLNRKTSDLDGHPVNLNYQDVAELRVEAHQGYEKAKEINDYNLMKFYDNKKKQYSADLGEMSTEGMSRKLVGDDATKLYSKYPGLNKTNNQFDQIYKSGIEPDITITFLEAKGGNSKLGSKMYEGERVQQGSKEYTESIIKDMNLWYEKASKSAKNPEEMAEFKKTLDYLEDYQENFKYKVVKQKLDSIDGALKYIEVIDYEH
ncbi:DUF637 domain-containing protein [Moritella sp. 36]|uniref:DUF637 domain-containing protein n=1 Tax=Moritella sp. 36 TaxID=2746233 RepID=UPI001BABBC2B|nr:DUF637 domain-containing protein [Moritella sp. 36]QUM89668.1 DUF637 domain-containing protein [Moritella sp. 36]